MNEHEKEVILQALNKIGDGLGADDFIQIVSLVLGKD
jgi:hypothetical protein